MTPALLTLLAACVLDRTGQSATAAYERELAAQAQRGDELERLNTDLERRLSQLEEVTRYQGQQEAQKLENLDQVRTEVQRLRGELETLQHTSGTSAQESKGFQETAAFRLDYAEQRLAAVERSLGLKPPPPPVPGGGPVVAAGGGGEVTLPAGSPDEVQLPASPEELLALAEARLKEGQPSVARALLERFLAQNPKHERAVEAQYRLAETWFNEGQYQRAILEFEKVVASHPDSAWAPWAMVRQGESFQKMGNSANATLFWEDVIARYPKSKAAKEAKLLLGK